MASSTTLRLIWESNNRASGTIRQINNDIESQKQKLRELQATESARAAQTRASFAQQRSLDAFNKLQADNSVQNQFRYQRALEASRAATARAEIANQRASVTLSQMGNRADNTGGLLTALGGKAAIAGAGIAVAFTAAAAAVRFFANAIQGAIDRETQLVSSTTELARGLSISRSEARGLSEEILRGIASETVGTGFGERSVAVAQQLLPTIARAGLSTTETEALAVSLSSRLGGVLAADDPARVQNFLIDFFNEDNIGRVLQQDINPALRNALRQTLKQRGLDENLSNVNAADRLKILEEAANLALPDEALLEQANTVKGLFGSLLDRLFNPYEGLFGVERDLDPNTNGYQTVFGAFKAATVALIGKNGVLDNFGKLMGEFGLNGDPLKIIYDGLIAFNEFLIDVNRVLIQLQGLNTTLEEAGFSIAETIDQIGKVLNFLNNLNPLNALNPFKLATAGQDLAERLTGVNAEPVGKANIFDRTQGENYSVNVAPVGGNASSSRVVQIGAGAIAINQLPNQDSTALAQEVILQLDQRLMQELEAVGG